MAGTDFAGADPEGNAEFMAADLQAKVEAMVQGAEGLGLESLGVTLPLSEIYRLVNFPETAAQTSEQTA